MPCFVLAPHIFIRFVRLCEEGMRLCVYVCAWLCLCSCVCVCVCLCSFRFSRTGAQGISTGKHHAAIICNDDALEALAVRAGAQTSLFARFLHPDQATLFRVPLARLVSVSAGKQSGDMVHPLLFAPEFLRSEYSSEVADMKNSVKNRCEQRETLVAAKHESDQ